MKVSVYNNKGKQAGDMELADAVFGVKPKGSVVHEVYTAIRANARQPWAHTKDRSDVSGGGRKPWKQKGTGRARHGSNRSPIWSGGGVTFGPLKIRNFSKKVNRKLSQLAVKMCLSGKLLEEKFVVVEDLENKDGKTQVFATLRSALPGAGYTTLVVTEEKDDMVLRAANNVPKVDVVRAADVNVVDLMHHQYVIVTKAAATALETRLQKK